MRVGLNPIKCNGDGTVTRTFNHLWEVQSRKVRETRGAGNLWKSLLWLAACRPSKGRVRFQVCHAAVNEAREFVCSAPAGRVRSGEFEG